MVGWVGQSGSGFRSDSMSMRPVSDVETGLENIFLFLAAKSKIKISCGRHE